jgi:hypothetical protein
VYRSDDGGLTYSLVTTCTISGTLKCTFVTNHFSLFAVGAPIVVVPSSGTSSGPGGPSMGGGWGSSFISLITNNVVNTGTLIPPNKDIIRKFIPKWNPRIQKPIIQNVKVFYRVNVPNSLNVRSSKSLTVKNIIGYLKK